MRDALLIFWIATMGADRIDLLAQAGPVTLPPYLLLLPLVLALELPSFAERKMRFPREGQVYLLLVCLLAALAMASAAASTDPGLSARRSVLLVIQILSILLVAVVLANRADPGTILRRGAYLGLAISFGFNVAQVVVWLNNPAAVGGGMVDLVPGRYGSLMPRPGGQTLDPNRGGMLFALYLFVLYRFGRPARARVAATVGTVLSLVLTLSRSATMGALTMAAVAVAEARRIRLTPARVAVGSVLAAAGILAIFTIPGAADRIAEVGEPLATRFSTRNAGKDVHVELVVRALDVAGRSWKNALIGIGYGNAGSVLTDLLPGTEYANFHSLYATLLAEMGIVGLLIGLAVLLYPAVRANPFRPVIVGFIFFNLFYQLLSEPAFWLVLSCAWLRVGARPPDEPGFDAPPRPASSSPPLADVLAR